MNIKTVSNAGFFVGVLGTPEEEAIQKIVLQLWHSGIWELRFRYYLLL
jgi:hypothetical protein